MSQLECNHIIMKLAKFFKILNKKIEKYDKMTSNPFMRSKVPITLVWIEDTKYENKHGKN